MAHGTFATVINCMDGRVQEPVISWMKQEHRVDFVDSVTEPGPVCILAQAVDQQTLDSIRRRVDISVNRHGSRSIAIVAHDDCAGNPVPMDEQLRQLSAAIATVRAWAFPVPVQGLWVDANRSVTPLP